MAGMKTGKGSTMTEFETCVMRKLMELQSEIATVKNETVRQSTILDELKKCEDDRKKTKESNKGVIVAIGTAAVSLAVSIWARLKEGGTP